MTTDHENLRLLIGGYLLGGLDDDDTDRLDAHLRDCDECRTELDRLGPIPELLRRLPAPVTTPVHPTPERIDGLLRQMRAERSRTRRAARVRWAVAAAAVVAVAAVGTVIAVTGTREPQPGPIVAAPTPTVSASSGGAPAEQPVTARFNAASGTAASGAAVLTARTWGVAVALDMTGLPGDGPFILRVTNVAGDVEQACIWGSTPSGRAKVNGASSMQLPTVRSVSIADHNGRVLATASL